MDKILHDKINSSEPAVESKIEGKATEVRFSEKRYHSRHVAKIIRTGQLLFSGPFNDDFRNEALCWFSHDDGRSPDCWMVMDNKQFLRMLKNNEIEFVKTDTPKNQLTMF